MLLKTQSNRAMIVMDVAIRGYIKKKIKGEDVKKHEKLRNATRKKYAIEGNIVIEHIDCSTKHGNVFFIIDIFNALVKKSKKKLLINGNENLR